jgi:Mrp family chromosome partitioning ATPase
VGLLLGILIMSLLIVLDQHLRNEKEVKEKLGLAYLGSLPTSADLQKAPARLTGDLARQVADVCANLRLTGILPWAWEAPHPAVLLVTSPLAAEGKTAVAVAIASAAASSGSRVVVVDGNLQRPSTHLAFRINPVGMGLGGLLKGGALEAVDDVVVRSTVPGLWLLPAGAPVEGASLLLEQRFQAVLGQLRQKADLIVIDGPSLLSGADASQLATLADGVALVVDARYARLSLLRRAKSLLVSLAHTHVGVVMNRAGKRGRNGYYAASYGDDAPVEQADVSAGAYNGHSTGIAAQMAPFVAPPPGYSMPSPPPMPAEPSHMARDGKNQQMVPPLFRRPQAMGE